MTKLTSRPLDRQSEGTQLFTFAVRRWVKAAVDGQCVCHVIGAAFRTAGLQEASVPFHAAMQTLCQNARLPLRFGTPERSLLSIQEAQLVHALGAAASDRQDIVRRIAEGLVFPDLAPSLSASLDRVSRAFIRSGFSFE